jgi:pilus assembly protein CpaB
VGRRLALLIAAVLIAAVGTGLVFAYVKKADDRAIADQKPVTVLVAKSSIAPGTRVVDAANSGAFQTQEFPQAAVVPGALSSVDPVKDQVVLTTIFPGQQLLTGMFGATAATNASIAIPPGQIAASFSFGDPQRVAGFVQPGSNVVIFLTSSLQGGKSITRVLLPKVTVIAVGPTTITPPADPAQANPEALSRAMLTLALTQRQAEKLIFAQGNGTMYLGLLNDRSQIRPGAGVSATNVFAS